MASEHQHKIGSGFGAKTTAEEVMDGVDLTGRLGVVTGGYSGIGTETTRALAAAGAHVVVPARRPDVARESLDGIDGVEVGELDLGDLDSVAAFAEAFLATDRPIDILIDSAAIMASPLMRVGQGWEAQFATNHLGHFALANRLWPALAAGGGARVVSVSSAGHRRSPIRWEDPHFETSEYDKWAAYGQAKTANALFALELDRLGADAGVHAFSLNPGGILTPLQRHLTHEEMVGYGWIAEDGTPRAEFKSTSQGAATSLWCATSAQLDGLGGVYCEDCDVAELVPADSQGMGGVRPYAADPEEAARLWSFSAELTGVDAFASS